MKVNTWYRYKCKELDFICIRAEKQSDNSYYRLEESGHWESMTIATPEWLSECITMSEDIIKSFNKFLVEKGKQPLIQLEKPYIFNINGQRLFDFTPSGT